MILSLTQENSITSLGQFTPGNTIICTSSLYLSLKEFKSLSEFDLRGIYELFTLRVLLWSNTKHVRDRLKNSGRERVKFTSLPEINGESKT